MRIDKFFGMMLALMIAWSAGANNVRIKNQAIPVEMNLGKDSLMVKFDVRWDNSWRLGENWDAVYVFLKYKQKNVNEKWYHLRIKEGGHSVVSGSGPGMMYRVMKDSLGGVGMLIYRRGQGTGNVSAEVRVKIDITKGEMYPYMQAEYQDFIRGKFEISAMAMEMVYVPYGPYYLGDGRSFHTFCDDGREPYYVRSEGAQTVGMDGGALNKAELPDFYPKGFSGFYCMKYEISQEQYVDFLNRIAYKDQKNRIGNVLEDLTEGQFVFGNPNMPDHRNGIILATKKQEGEPWVFANNLNIRNEFNMPDDGQTLACNYMTPEDLWAYADWVGLRPMSEMEYEKACRQRNPESKPTDFQYAWDSQNITPIASLSNAMTAQEKPDAAANVNTGGAVNGPVRCGAFARPGNTAMENAGGTHWGIMDMTGNLAEICCNVEGGVGFNGEVYGDGSMVSTPLYWKMTKLEFRDSVGKCSGHSWTDVINGNCGYSHDIWEFRHRIYKETPYFDLRGRRIIIDMLVKNTVYADSIKFTDPYAPFLYFDCDTTVLLPYYAWADSTGAYGTRGGSYATNTRDYNLLTISGRGQATYFQGGMVRNPECTFRLIRAVETERIGVGNIILPNGAYLDSIVTCVDGNYEIKEEFAGTTPAAVIYNWECDKGTGWEVMPGKTDPTMVLNEMWNNDTSAIKVKFRRKTMAPEGEGYSNEVTLVIAGVPFILPTKAQVDYCDNGAPLMCQYNLVADTIRWTWRGKLLFKEYNVKKSSYYPKYNDFGNPGNYTDVLCEVYLKGCRQQLVGSVNVSVQAVTCPNNVTDPLTGKTYAVIKTRNCRCWMAEDLNTPTTASQMYGSRMYNWDDLHLEPTSENLDKNPSELCPPGFYVPTEAELNTLVTDLAGDPVTTQAFLNGGVGGFWDAVGGTLVEQQDYYWAGLYTGIEIWKPYVSFPVLWYDSVTKQFKIVYEVYLPDDGAYYETSGGENDPGTFFFPVRCIMKK